MSQSAGALAILAAVLWIEDAAALGLDVATEIAEESGEVTFTVGLTESAFITGYELFLGWDAEELTFSAGTPIWGSGFALAPSAEGWEGSRVAQLSFVLVEAHSLFSMTFATSAWAAFDGGPDFYVTTGRGGVSRAPGAGLLALLPAGIGFDLGPSGVAQVAVPELVWAPPPPPPVMEDDHPGLRDHTLEFIDPVVVDPASLEIRLPTDLESSQIGDVRHRFAFGRYDFVWSATTNLSLAVPEPRLPLLGLAALTALVAGKRRFRK